MKLYFIRHGRQDSMLCNVDVGLSKEGHKQADLAGKRLKGLGIDALYTSDMARAIETGEEISKHIDIKGKVLRGLRETEFGDMEGLTDEEMKEKYKDFYIERDKFLEDLSYPNGENGKECYDRMIKAVRQIIEECEKDKKENIAIVSHGGAIRCFLTGILGMDFARRLQFVKTMENCSITEIHYDKKWDRFYIERVNDYSHLEGHEELLRKHFKKTFL